MGYRELLRRKMISDILDRMSEEEKESLYALVLRGEGQSEIMEMLRKQHEQLQEIKKGQSWWLDLSANVAGNGIYDIVLWLGRKIIGK